MTIILLFLYPIAVQFNRGGWFLLLAPITVFTLALDVLANYTELALLTWDFPRTGEYTFSTRLERLGKNTDWRGSVARGVISYLNLFSLNHVVLK
jgi:hypothetical protein